MKDSIYVLKFGGTSIANVERINYVAGRVHSYIKKGRRLIIVVSAMGDTTNELISLAKDINPSPSDREMDMLISTGEQISGSLLAMALHKKNIDAISLLGHQVGIITDGRYTQAKILKIKAERIKKEIKEGRVVIVTGFQGATVGREITTLGRGGSDLSAVALAVSLNADMCEIYTDVEGIYTADPRIVPRARKIKNITFDEMLELAAGGARVMQTRAIEVAKKFNMPLHVRSSFTRKEGTIIMKKTSYIEEPIVRGIALMEDEVKVTISDVPDRPGIAALIFTQLASNDINVDMIVQNVSRDRSTDISFTIPEVSLNRMMKISTNIVRKIGAREVITDKNVAKVSIIGVGMKTHSGVAAKGFQALARNKINIEMISTSEISISCMVEKKMGKKAVNILHKVFGLDKALKGKKLKEKARTN